MNLMGFYLFLAYSNFLKALSLEISVFVIYALSLLAVFLGFGFVGVDLIGFKLVGVDLFRALVYTFCAVPWFAIIFRFIKRKWFSSRIRPLYRILLILLLIHFVQPISAMDIGMESEAFTLTGSAVVTSLAVHTFPQRFYLTPTYTVLPSRQEQYNYEEHDEYEVEESNPDGCLCPPCSESSESDSECSDAGSLCMNVCSPRHESESDEANNELCPPCDENVEVQDDEDEANLQKCHPCQDHQFEGSDSDGSVFMNGWNWYSPGEGSEHFEESDEANLETCPPCDVEENVEGQDDEDDNDDPGDESEGEDTDASVQEVIPFCSYDPIANSYVGVGKSSIRSRCGCCEGECIVAERKKTQGRHGKNNGMYIGCLTRDMYIFCVF
jgi:hypothetical protein